MLRHAISLKAKSLAASPASLATSSTRWLKYRPMQGRGHNAECQQPLKNSSAFATV